MRFVFTFSYLLCFAFCISCNSQMNDELAQSKLDSAKAFFFQAEKLSPNEAAQFNENLLKSKSLLSELIDNSKLSADAEYFYAYTLDRLYTGQEAGINFKTISYKNAKEISSHLEKVIKAKPDFASDYKLSPYNKISSTWGSLALYYIVFNKPDSAKIAFTEGKKAGGFSQANLEYSKNLLSSCNNDAILFVNGDIETFALWYLQYTEGFRKDVSVINLGMLASYWYAKWVKNADKIGPKTDYTYSDDKIDTLFFAPFSYTYNLKKVITLPKEKNPLYYEFPSLDESITLDLRGRAKTDSAIVLFPNDEVVLSIIEYNILKRPIYFSLTAGRDVINSIGVDSYLVLEGLAARLMPYKVPMNLSINIQKTSHLLENKFDYKFAKEEASFKDKDFKFLCEFYKYSFIQMIYYYFQIAPSKEKCKEFLEKYTSVFSAKTLPLNESETDFFNQITEFVK